RLLAEEPKTYALIFETGDELAGGLSRFASQQRLAGSSFKAIRAFSSVNGQDDWPKKLITRFSRIGKLVSHSHITRNFPPSAFSLFRLLSSRARFRSSLGTQ